MMTEVLLGLNLTIFIGIVMSIILNQKTRKELYKSSKNLITKNDLKEKFESIEKEQARNAKGFDMLQKQVVEQINKPEKVVVMEKDEYENSRVDEWLKLVKDEESNIKKAEILRVAFSQYTSSAQVYKKYIEVLDQLLVKTYGSVDIIRRKQEVIDSYLLFCKPSDFSLIKKAQFRNSKDYKKYIEQKRKTYLVEQTKYVEEIETIVNEIELESIDIPQAYAAIKKIDDMLDKTFIEKSELSNRYKKLIDKIYTFKDLRDEERVKYNSIVLERVEEIHKKFNDSQKIINKVATFTKEINKKISKKTETDEIEDVDEILMNRILELEDVDMEKLFEEVLRYLSITKNEIFTKLNRQDKLTYTKRRLAKR